MNINIQVDKSLFGGGNSTNQAQNQLNSNGGQGAPMININPPQQNSNGNSLQIGSTNSNGGEMMSRMNSGSQQVIPRRTTQNTQYVSGNTMNPSGNTGYGVPSFGGGTNQQRNQGSSNYKINQLPPRPSNQAMQPSQNNIQNTNNINQNPHGIKPSNLLGFAGSSLALPNITSHRSVTMNQYDQQQQQQYMIPSSRQLLNSGQELNQHMTLNIPFDDVLGAPNEDFDQNGNDLLNEFDNGDSNERRDSYQRRKSLSNQKPNTNLISYSINTQNHNEGSPEKINGGVIDIAGRRNLKHTIMQENGTSRTLTNPNGLQAEQYSVNVTITKVGNNIIQSKIDITKQMLTDEFEEQKILDEQEMQQIMSHNRFDYNNSDSRKSRTSSQNSHQLGKSKGAMTLQSPTHLALPDLKNTLNNAQPQDGDNPHSLRKSNTNENLGGQPELDSTMKKYDPRSLYFFNIHWKLRQLLIKLMIWKYYEYFMMFTIFGNSLCLALNDYQDDNNITIRNQTLQKIDQVFTIIYTSECVLKILAFGMVFHKRSYLRDGWNVLDFIIVITGLITLIPNVPNLKSLRIMRVLRPLRSIHTVPSMKRQVRTLIMSLPQMGYVASLLFFFICVFAILGIQIFARDLYNRCRLTDEPILGMDGNYTWPIDPTQQRCCGGLYTCNSGTYCHSLREKQIPLSVDKIEEQDFIFWGFLSFDNIGVSILSIFRVITLEDWSYVMYNYMDSSGIIAALYFPLLVVIGSFFLLNLFLAVIMESFADMSSRPVVDPEQELLMESMETEDGNTLNSSAEVMELQKLQNDEEITRMIAVTKKRMEMLHKGPMSLQDAAVMMIEQKRKIASDMPVAPAITTIDQQFPDLNPVQEMDEVFQSPELKMRRSSLSFADQQIPQSTQGKGGPVETDPLHKFDESPRDLKRTDDKNLVKIPLQRPVCGRFQECVLSFCESTFFAAFINLSIILNTICLALDAYPPNQDLQSTLDTINIIFFGIFFAEMIIKNFGMGPRLYIRDTFNIFDAIIVLLSIVDVIFTYALPGGADNTSKGPITAFRAFRLLRVFKLSKSWKKLHYLLSTIGRALREISSFSVLLFLLVFIYVLLGMELFAKRNNDTKSNSLSIEDYVAEPRLNFDNFFNGFILIFTLLTGESWDLTMLQFATSHGFYAIYFFMSFMLIGVMIFLNLFLAILLENFDEEEPEEEENEELANLSFGQKATHYTVQFYNSLRSSFNGLKNKKEAEEKIIQIQPTEELLNPTQTDTVCDNRKRKVMKQSSIVTFENEDDEERARDHLHQLEHTINLETQNQLDQAINIGITNVQIGNETLVKRQAGSDMNVIAGHSILKKVSNKKDSMKMRRGESILKNQNLGTNASQIDQSNTNQLNVLDSENPNIDFNSSQGEIASRNNIQLVNQLIRKDSLVLSQDEAPPYDINGEEVKIKDELLKADEDEEELENEIEKYELEAQDLNARNGFIKKSRTRRTGIIPSSSDYSNGGIKKAYSLTAQQVHNNDEFDRESDDFDSSKKLKAQNTKSIALIMKQKVYEQNIAQHNLSQYANYCEGNSLFFFGPFNPFRVGVLTLIKSPSFEGFILFLITIQSILLALDNPLNDPDGLMVEFLHYSDIVFSTIFAIEAALKIIAYGFFFNRDVAYLKNGWNIIDMFVVIISLVSINVSNKLKIIKIFRMFRVLRPLRVISRNKGLRIGIQALFMAVPSIISVLIVSLLFYIIFGIIGVNYFKGGLYSCQYGDTIPIFLQPPPLFAILITDKWSCLNYGGVWVNYDYHFNNLPDAVSTLFQMSTTEGWVDVMFHGVDSVDIDIQPVLNYNIYWSLFFMVFVFFGNFLILDLFTGVVVQTFNKEKEILAKNFLLTDNQKKWIEQKKICMQIKPKILEGKKYSPCRQSIRNLIMNKKFDVFILVCIFLNSCVLAINWYSQEKIVDDVLNYINYGFAIIFTLEAVLKLIALGCRTYFRSGGNIFDMIIVVTSIISSVISLLLKIDFGASTTFIRALRISRVLKFVQKAKQIRVIIDTFTFVLPALTNIGGLLVLFLYIFSILGVFLFSQVKQQYWLDEHANFQSFGSAFLTLLRCSTGEAWNSIMVDTMRQNQILFQCSDDFDYQTYVDNGFQTYGCGSTIAGLIFFMIFMLIVPLIFLDLFIAIILEGFEIMSQNINIIIPEFELHKFRDCWAEFDKDGTGFIAVADFPQFMLMLDDPIGWNPKLYEQNQRLQDDFLEELNVKTYDEFKYYLFWEVLQGLTKMYIIKMDLLRRIEKAEEILAKKKFINGEEADEESEKHDLNNPVTLHEQKLQLRIELEFETIDDERKDAMDVEEVKMQEYSVIKGYLHRQDESYTSAHIKAGRRILTSLKALRSKRIGLLNTAALGGTIQKITISTNDKVEAQNIFGNISHFSEEFKIGDRSNPKLSTPIPVNTNNGPFIFRNNNFNKQQSINTSDEMTIFDGEVDFADGGTGAKKMVLRQQLMTPINIRPTTQSIIGQSSAMTPGMAGVGTTGSPVDIMMNDLDIDNQESSPDIIGARNRNNLRSRAIAQLRQQKNEDQSVYIDQQQFNAVDEDNERNDWNDIPANMQKNKRNQLNVLDNSTPYSIASGTNPTPHVKKTARKAPFAIIMNCSDGFDEFREQQHNINNDTFDLKLDGISGQSPAHEMISRHVKSDSQNNKDSTSKVRNKANMLGSIPEHTSIEQYSFEDELK